MQWFIDIRSAFLVPEELKKVTIVSPCVPCVNVYLYWIGQLKRECGPIFIDEMVNIPRLLAIGNAVFSFVRIQQSPPSFEIVPVVQNYLYHTRTLQPEPVN